MTAVRALVAWFPDWPLVAAGCPPDIPALVLHANRVVAATPAARAEGVREGLRRREAQARCPGVRVVEEDAGRDARAWEPAVAAVESLAPAVEVVASGELVLATRGPSRYFGGDAALAELVCRAIDEAAGQEGCRGGVADGRFAAALAARAAGNPSRVLVVRRGDSPRWLAPQPVTSLGAGYEELTDLLVRLGIRTLGELGELPGRAVLGRFGTLGQSAHRLARGLDERPVAARVPPPGMSVGAEQDPPLDRVETAAFVAKSLADELLCRLEHEGLAATMVAIEAQTEHGESLLRHWRHDGSLTAAGLAERARWQLDGWIGAGGDTGGPTAGITFLRLTAEEVRPDRGKQLGFWGGVADADDQAARAFARVQGLLGPDGVVTAVLGGGRGFAEQARLVPWGDCREPPSRSAGDVRLRRRRPTRAGGSSAETPPWPGRVCGPAPAVVHTTGTPMRDVEAGAEVLGPDGLPVEVSARGLLSAVPASVSVAGGAVRDVTGWAGPWPIEERWWDGGGRRRARLQVLLDNGEAHLLSRERGCWTVEASYC